MTSTEKFTSLNGQAREATEKTAEVFKRNLHQATERAEDMVAQLPTVNLSEGVERYFEFVQKAVDLQRDMATKWAELLTAVSGSLREQLDSFSHLVTEQTDKAADMTVRQAEKAEQAAKEQAREAKRVERDEAMKSQQQARQAYEGLTKAELSDQLSERGLPKTGTVEELVERLVTADSN